MHRPDAGNPPNRRFLVVLAEKSMALQPGFLGGLVIYQGRLFVAKGHLCLQLFGGF